MGTRVDKPERLDEFLRSKRDKSEDFKALVLKLVNRVENIKEVSSITGVPEATIYEWIREWNQEKEVSLENYRGEGGGRKPKLTQEQNEKLKDELKKRKFWTTKEVKTLSAFQSISTFFPRLLDVIIIIDSSYMWISYVVDSYLFIWVDVPTITILSGVDTAPNKTECGVKHKSYR